MDAAEPLSVLALACALDHFVGEPPAALHPVVWMGRAIAPLKRMRPRGPRLELAIGVLYVAGVTLAFALFAHALVSLDGMGRWVARAIEVFVLWSCFALRGLVAAADEVARALSADDLPRARYGLGSLCSRDPSALSAAELAGASIESVAENASDSVIAPLFYFALLGVPGAVFYRVANTLDAMVGYRGRYEYLGKAAARLDDLLNLVPARLTALLMLIAGVSLRMPVARGLAVWWRDRGRTESPNAGWPMALASGLLGVRLDKRGAYVLGAALAPPDAAALTRALPLVRRTGWLGAGFAALLLVLGARLG